MLNNNENILLSFKIDDAFNIIPLFQYGDIVYHDHISVTVMPPRKKLIINKNIYFVIKSSDCSKIEIVFNEFKLYIFPDKKKHWNSFIDKYLVDFVGLMTAFLLSKEKEDFLWIEKHNEFGDLWIIYIMKRDGLSKGYLLKRKKLSEYQIDKLFRNYDIEFQDDDKYSKKLYNMFIDQENGFGFPDNDINESSCNLSMKLKLIIKVHNEELWFLIFPIDQFCFFNHGTFSMYNKVEWIITSKNFIQNYYENLKIQRELSNISNTLKKSVVILNVYSEEWFSQSICDDLHEYLLKCFEKMKSCNSCFSKELLEEKLKRLEQIESTNHEIKMQRNVLIGTCLLFEILSYLQDVTIYREDNKESLSLEVYFNPNEDQINKILKNTNINYIFGNFHVVNNGKWKLLTGNEYDLTKLKTGYLKHLRLLKIYHCYSIIYYKTIGEFDNDSSINNMISDLTSKAVKNSITGLLLKAGALRVEGSIIKDNYFHYIRFLLALFCGNRGLRPILIGKSIERGLDPMDIINRVDEFLFSCGLKSINDEHL